MSEFIALTGVRAEEVGTSLHRIFVRRSAILGYGDAPYDAASSALTSARSFLRTADHNGGYLVTESVSQIADLLGERQLKE